MKKAHGFLCMAALATVVAPAGSGEGGDRVQQARARARRLAPAAEPALPGYVIERVARTGEAIPGGSGGFVALGVPCINGGTVAFRGDGPDGQKGVYAWREGALARVADLDTPAPGAGGNFTFFGSTALEGSVSVASDGSVAFHGQSAARHGIYTDRMGALTMLVDSSFAVPGNPGGAFGNFFHLSHDAGQVAFTAVSTGFRQGLYLTDGSSLSVVADPDILMPGSTLPFSDFGLSGSGGTPSLHAGDIAFVGSADNQHRGLYASVGGILIRIADQSTVMPGAGTGQFFEEPDLHAGEIAFRTGAGIYRAGAGGLELVARERNVASSGFGTVLGPPAIEGPRVMFDRHFYYVLQPYLSLLVKAGVYTRLDGGELQAVVDSSRRSRLDRKRVKTARSGNEGLSGGRYAFLATFGDGSQGIYVARPEDVP
jgi:hypothetical protein